MALTTMVAKPTACSFGKKRGSSAMATPRAKVIHKEETLYRTLPQWSPDGKRMVYASHLGGQYTELFVLPTVGGEPYKMTFSGHDNFLPRWSPDGEWIAYISNEEGVPQLKLMKSWGGEQKIVRIAERRYARPMATQLRARVAMPSVSSSVSVGSPVKK